MLEMLEIEPRGAAHSAVIWLHGLGASGDDFVPLIQQWGLADELGVRFVLPHAPQRPVTLNGGMVIRAWYDLYDLGFGSGEDREGIEQAQQQLLELVSREQQRGIPAERILLAGFSQGGAMALYTALRYPQPLAGVLVLSGYLPLAERLAAEKRADAALAIRIDHGKNDPVVPFATAQATRNTLQAEGFTVEFHAYAMEHSLCPPQIETLRHWIVERLGRAD